MNTCLDLAADGEMEVADCYAPLWHVKHFIE